MLNPERILERLEELYAYKENFPHSTLSEAIEKEIEYLESLTI